MQMNVNTKNISCRTFMTQLSECEKLIIVPSFHHTDEVACFEAWSMFYVKISMCNMPM